MFSGVEEGSFRWAPSTAMFEALLGNGGGVLSYIEHLDITSICVLYWCDFKWFQMIVKFPGRSPNVWAPLRSFHCLCLCHVKFHQVQGAGASGCFHLFLCIHVPILYITYHKGQPPSNLFLLSTPNIGPGAYSDQRQTVHLSSNVST